MQALSNKVVIEEHKYPTKTESGLTIPEDYFHKNGHLRKGTVISVSYHYLETNKAELKSGDSVWFDDYKFRKFKHSENEYWAGNVEDVYVTS